VIAMCPSNCKALVFCGVIVLRVSGSFTGGASAGATGTRARLSEAAVSDTSARNTTSRRLRSAAHVGVAVHVAAAGARAAAATQAPERVALLRVSSEPEDGLFCRSQHPS
jgi:hypothetical protein